MRRPAPPPGRAGGEPARWLVPALLGGAGLAAAAALALLLVRPLPAPASALAALLGVLAALLAASAAAHRRTAGEVLARERELIALVSHQMRTPLAQIRLYGQTLLLGRETGPEERRRWLELIDGEAARLAELVDNSLLLARLHQPDVYLFRRPVELAPVLEGAAAACAVRAAVREMRISTEAPDGVSAMVDPDAVRQLVLNLLDNAVRFGAPGQVIHLALERRAEGVVLSVADAGPGVPAASRERIWEPFAHAEGGGRESTDGSGLGLAVVRQVAEAHGGRAFLEDAPGGGARFGVVLPAAAEPGPAVAGALLPLAASLPQP